MVALWLRYWVSRLVVISADWLFWPSSRSLAYDNSARTFQHFKLLQPVVFADAAGGGVHSAELLQYIGWSTLSGIFFNSVEFKLENITWTKTLTIGYRTYGKLQQTERNLNLLCRRLYNPVFLGSTVDRWDLSQNETEDVLFGTAPEKSPTTSFSKDQHWSIVYSKNRHQQKDKSNTNAPRIKVIFGSLENFSLSVTSGTESLTFWYL